MAWSTPAAFAVLEYPTAAKMNVLADDLKYLKGQAGTIVLEDNIEIGAGPVRVKDANSGIQLERASLRSLMTYQLAVAGSVITVIPDAAGDVTAFLSGWFGIKTSSGIYTIPATNLAVSASTAIYTSGGEVLTAAVTAGGAFTLQRTGGTLTYDVHMFLMWR